MATTGKLVLREGGKRGLLSGGKAAIFNADGECPSCCGGAPPADCSCCDAATLDVFVTLRVTDGSSYGWCPSVPVGEYSGSTSINGGCTGPDSAAWSGTITLAGQVWTVELSCSGGSWVFAIYYGGLECGMENWALAPVCNMGGPAANGTDTFWESGPSPGYNKGEFEWAFRA